MAHIFVKNSLSNLKNAKINVSFPKFVTPDTEGDPVYVIETATTYKKADGYNIRPCYVHNTEQFKNLDEAIANSVSVIAAQIDWLPLVKDVETPYITAATPVGNDIPISSNVYVDITDNHPSSGIDLSNAKITLYNGQQDFDITTECKISGDPFQFSIQWIPPREFRRYSE